MIHAQAYGLGMRRALLTGMIALALTSGPAQASWLSDLFDSESTTTSGIAAPPPTAASDKLDTTATDAALAAAEYMGSGRDSPLTDAKRRVAPRPVHDDAAAVAPTAPSGESRSVGMTEVGKRAQSLHDDIVRLGDALANDTESFDKLHNGGTAGSVQYHSLVAAIVTHLQNGTTRGNPVLERQWHEAEQNLNLANGSLEQLNALSANIANDASVAGYLLGSIQAAFQLSGAVDEDHAQLTQLRNEVNRLILQTDDLRNRITADIQRQTAYLTTERSNLQTLYFAIARGELNGGGLAGRATGDSAAAPRLGLTGGMATPDNFHRNALVFPQNDLKPAKGRKSAGSGKLLTQVRLTPDNVAYERQVTRAVATVLEQSPDARFTVVGIAPGSGDAASIAVGASNAQRHAEAIKTLILQMGLDPARILVTQTESTRAQTPEVQIYVH